MASSLQKRKKKRPTPQKTTDFPEAFLGFLCSNINGYWFAFGKTIGFQHDHLKQLQDLYPGNSEKCTETMLKEWRRVAGNHTTKLFSLLYFGLDKLRPDLAVEMLKRTSFERPSPVDKPADIWNDLTQDLRKIDFSNGSYQGSTQGVVTYNFNGCSDIVVGDRFTIVQQAKQDYERNDATIIEKLKLLLLDKFHNGMNLQKLEATLMKQIQGETDTRTFQQIMGRKLKSFIEDNGEDFDIKSDGKQLKVFLKLPAKKANTESSPAPSVCSSMFSEADGYQTTEDPPWTTVKRRQRKTASSKQTQEQFPPLRSVPSNFQRNILIKKQFTKSYACVAKRNSETPTITTHPPPKRKPTTSTTEATCFQSETPSESNKVEDFLKYVKNFSHGHYILFSSQRSLTKHRETLALIPWLCVFDFDEYSRVDGLLSVLEDRLRHSRALYVCTWKDQPRISHYGTQWCLLRGSIQEADSRTMDDPKLWFKAIRNDFERHLQDLASFADNYTTLKVIILWPDESDVAEYIYKALSKMDEYIEDYTTILWDLGRAKDEEEMAIMKMLKPNFKITCSLDNICQGIHSILDRTCTTATFQYRLPTEDESNNPNIDESTASLLREDLDILYLKNPYANEETDLEVLKRAAESFYKGGNLPWKLFYDFGSGHLDADRDIMPNMITKIRNLIGQFKSGRITIYHAPGSGCTTMVQRILWELRLETPCAQVRLNPRTNLQTIVQQIETLYDKTNLPLVLLLDGDDQQRIQHLSKMIEHSHTVVIFINTKRYPYKIKDIILQEDHFSLSGEVSQVEAKKLWTKFETRCDTDKKKDNLSQLVSDVGRGVTHCMYEFGLLTYLNDYKGIDSYIAGYFIAEKNQGELEKWQRILGYLSLVYYYGHTSMPCQFFVTLLGLPPTADVVFDSFPFQVQQFVVSCDGNLVRLCHYVVAKGILEHILSPTKIRNDKESRDSLKRDARRNLYKFVLEFIDDIKARRSKNTVKASVLTDILARTIIYRDNRDIGENEVQKQARKPNLSRLLSDIESQPPYTERVNLMKKLTDAFPEDPNFHAHLGRMYSICRPEEEKEAEKCFDIALDLCNRRAVGTKYEDLDDSTKHTLKHVYHMFGIFYLQRITKYTGRTHGDTPEVKLSKEDFPQKLKELFALSERACEYFSQTRELTMSEYIEAHGFTGEISVRLRICEFIYRNMPFDDFEELLQATDRDTEMASYIQESITTVQELFLQSYGMIDIDELPKDFFDSIHWYNALFKDKCLQRLNFSETIYQRRLKVATIKLKYGKDKVLGSLENINNSTDLNEIVRICEINFKEQMQTGLLQSRRALDLEYKDWINAIRHEFFRTQYEVEDVLTQVRFWHNTLQSPNSKFFLFILLSILGFGLPHGTPNDDMLREARALKEQLNKLSKHIAKPRKPREWLGRGPGIKNILLQGRKVHRSDEDGLSKQKDDGVCHMTIMKGTICRPNLHRQTGYIQLDLGDKNRFPVKVFFVPVRQNPPLVGRQYAGERVEFVMAFTNADGYEAYNVMRLEKCRCECGRQTEIPSDEYIGTCECGKKVSK